MTVQFTFTSIFVSRLIFVSYKYVPPRGFEPPTNSLGNCCSIHTELRGQINFLVYAELFIAKNIKKTALFLR